MATFCCRRIPCPRLSGDCGDRNSHLWVIFQQRAEGSGRQSVTNKMDSIKNQFHSCYRNEQRKGKKGNSTAFRGGRAQREESNLLKRNIHFATVQRNVPLEKFWFLIWIHVRLWIFLASVLVLGNPGSARSRVQTCFLDLSQTLPQGSRSLFLCVCTSVMGTHVRSHVCKCVQMYTCVFLFSQHYGA